MSLLRPSRLLLALGSGIALAFAFPAYNAPVLAWISLAGLVLASLDERWWFAAVCGLLHGAGFYTATLPWIYTVMRVHGGLSPVEAAGVLALLVAYLASFPTAFSIGVAYLSR